MSERQSSHTIFIRGPLQTSSMPNFDDFVAGNEEFVATFKDGDKPMPPARKALLVTCMDGALPIPRREPHVGCHQRCPAPLLALAASASRSLSPPAMWPAGRTGARQAACPFSAPLCRLCAARIHPEKALGVDIGERGRRAGGALHVPPLVERSTTSARWCPSGGAPRPHGHSCQPPPAGDIHVVRNAGGRAVDAVRSVTISQQLLGTTEVSQAVRTPHAPGRGRGVPAGAQHTCATPCHPPHTLALATTHVRVHAHEATSATHHNAMHAVPPSRIPAFPQIFVVHHTDCGMLTFSTPQLQGIVKDRLGHDDATHYHEFRWGGGGGGTRMGWGSSCPPSDEAASGGAGRATCAHGMQHRRGASLRLPHPPQQHFNRSPLRSAHPTWPSPLPPKRYTHSDLEKSVRDDVALLKASPVVRPGTPIRGGIYDVRTGKISWLSPRHAPGGPS